MGIASVVAGLSICVPWSGTVKYVSRRSARLHGSGWVPAGNRSLGFVIVTCHFCGGERAFSVVIINDDREPVEGKLLLSIETQEGAPRASREVPFHLGGFGRDGYEVVLPIPKETGKYLLKAVACPRGTRHKSPTVSRRKISVEPKAP